MTQRPLLERMLETIRYTARTPIDRTQHIYCNRDLDLAKIDAIGFDMDYTLAVYNQEAMNRITINLTLPKLIDICGHPPHIVELDFPERFAIRGLLVDQSAGNILKLDNHRRLHKAYHGFRELTAEELAPYQQHPIRLNTDQYALVDTLYGLPEATLFAALVDSYEQNGGPPNGGWKRLYDDIRHCVDLAHRDGRLERAILDNLDTFILPHDELGPTLSHLKTAGKKLFVITNSFPRYTMRVLGHLFDGVLGEGTSWRDLFDVVVSASHKPSFFEGSAPFHLIDEETLEAGRIERTRFETGRMYRGGNLNDFIRMSGYPASKTLYIGDHIYGDILRSRKASTWRAVMIVRELEEELLRWDALHHELVELNALEDEIEHLTQSIAYERRVQQNIPELLGSLDQTQKERPENIEAALKEALDETISQLSTRRERLLQGVIAEQAKLEDLFNPFWGLIFKSGNKNSIFGEQVEDYACLYTSKVENFAHYSPQHYFRAPRQPMPHEM